MEKIVNFLKKYKNGLEVLCCLLMFFFPLLSLIPSISSFNQPNSVFVAYPILGTLFKAIVFGLFLLVSLVIVFLDKIKFDRRLIILLLLYFLLSIFPNIFLNSEIVINLKEFDKVVSFVPTMSELISSSVFCLRFILLTIFYLSIIPQIIKKDLLKVVINLFILLGCFTIFYALALQTKELINNIVSNSTITGSVTSIFLNKNTFGIVLGACTALCLVMIAYSKNPKFYTALLALFYISSVFVLSRTSLIAQTVMILIFVFGNAIFLKKMKGVALTIIILVLILVLYIILIFSVKNFRESIFINNKIYGVLNQFLKDSSTATHRVNIWAKTFAFLATPVRSIFGYGDQIATRSLTEISTAMAYYNGDIYVSFHNGIVESLIAGGLIRTLIYFYIIYKFILKPMTNSKIKNFSITTVSIFIAFFIIQLFEELILFETAFGSNFWTFVLVCPFYLEKIMQNNEQKNSNDSPVINKNNITFCVTTISKTKEEIISNVKMNGLSGNVVVGCQKSDKEYVDHFVDDNLDLTIYFQTSTGVSVNRNYLLDRVKTDYCEFLDDDITFLDQKFILINKEIADLNDFDFIFFNFKYKDNRIVKWKFGNRFRRLDGRSFGINSIIFNVNFLKENNIRFNENIGPGRKVSSGEDGQFAMLAASKTRKGFARNTIIIEISYEKGSTWFGGYDESYFFNIGYTYGMCYGWLAKPFAIYTLLKHKNTYLKEMNFKNAFTFIKSGLKCFYDDK